MSNAFHIEQPSGAVERLIVVLGDQLDHDARMIREASDRDVVLMMEVEEESRHVASHRQRTTLFLSAMRHFALDLVERGLRVRYVRLNDPHNRHSIDLEVRRAVELLAPAEIVSTHPGEHRLLVAMEGWRDLRPLTLHPDESFLTSIEAFTEWAEGRKSLVMEYFYRSRRRALDVLMRDDGEPEGGQWNFDKQNRSAFRSRPAPPSPYRARPDDVTTEVMSLVERRLPSAPGRMSSFIWPVTRDEALRGLHRFIEERLPSFGTYQDAMWTDEAFLFHSHLSPALNLKLLKPDECVDAAIDSYERGAAPLNAVEGFVRQIIGWREFIRGVYWFEGAEYGARNALHANGALPALYWSGETDMKCMRQCVGQVLDHAYGHHIQRLMVTGNFALISGVHPRAVADWYLGMYIDAVDWVTLPNTLGMVMHADGGVVGTKPYAASGSYINRMSNYCDGCRYDVSRRSGEDACPFNVFYWDFLNRNRSTFEKNHRMGLILKNLDRMDRSELVSITRDGETLRDEFGIAV